VISFLEVLDIKRVAMTRKTSVEIDEKLLSGVQSVLHTRTIRETIDEAFREILRIEARKAEIEALTRMDTLDLADPAIMSKAWR
jgi:Arc/MetJ family transcription regulator